MAFSTTRCQGLNPFLGTLVLVLIMTLLAGCGSKLPDDVRNRARQIPDLIKKTENEIKKNRDQFDRLKKSSEFKPVERFALKENWEKNFSTALDSLARAKEMSEKELAPLVKKNRPESANEVIVQTKRISQVLEQARQTARLPLERFSRIKNALENMAPLRDQAIAQADKIQETVNNLGKGPVAKARAQFPDSAAQIDARFAKFLKINQETIFRFQVIEKTFQDHASGMEADYAAFIDSADGISRDFAIIARENKSFETKLAQLYQSYTKILQDMKEDYFVTVKRESWDERSDYDNPKVVSFQRQVSPEVFEALDQTDLESIASITPGFTGLSFSTKLGNTWSKLGINPTEQWQDRNHNAALFWVENSSSVYYHKYLLEENGETRETDWVKVNPSFYEQHFEHLGMAILSKPYGVFEEDSLTQAAPPGISYVGNPKYGEWKKDEQGTSFWSWYGRYAFFSNLFFFRPSYFSYNSWHGWNSNYRNRQPYFGKAQNGTNQYGTHGSYVKNSPRYQSTSFAKTGGFKSRPPSVRGAASSVRGGGPKGKGK